MDGEVVEVFFSSSSSSILFLFSFSFSFSLVGFFSSFCALIFPKAFDFLPPFEAPFIIPNLDDTEGIMIVSPSSITAPKLNKTLKILSSFLSVMS